ncbi:hypothetical protein D3C84_602660 [compost metagenome]
MAGGDFETEGAQLFPVDLFDFRVTFYPQRLRLLTNQDVGVLLSADVFIQVAEGQRCAVLDVALHFAVARFEGAELDAGQPQARHRLYGVDQLLRERCGRAVFQDGLELFQQLQVCGGRRVLQGVLDFEQHRRAMLAVHPYRATAQGVDQQQCAFGRLAQGDGLAVDIAARALATGGDSAVAGFDDPDAVFQGVAAATLQALFLESAGPGRGQGLAQARGHRDFNQSGMTSGAGCGAGAVRDVILINRPRWPLSRKFSWPFLVWLCCCRRSLVATRPLLPN